MSRVVFMGTPDFAVPILAALIRTQTVVGVVTQPDRPAGRGRKLRMSPVKRLALVEGLPVYQPSSLRRRSAAVPIAEWQPDAIVVAAFGQILRDHLLELPPLGCINVHASLLPRWRGAAPIQHAILAGDRESGVCLMQMDAGIDTGPVYSCMPTEIEADETAATLHDRLAALGAAIIERDLPLVLAGELQARAQQERLATYAPMIDKQSGEIDWTQSAEQIERRIRAMTPWPGAFSSWNGRLFKIIEAAVTHGEPGPPGLVHGDDVSAKVLTGHGGLVLRTVQLAGRKANAIDDFLRGHPELIGSRLGANE